MAGGLAGCRCDACQEWERGLVLALDRSLCPDIPVTGDITLCIYATDGQALTVRYYDDPRDVASLLLPLRAGHYTVAATVNARPDKEATASLTALHEWLVAQAPDCPQLLSGMTEADVAAEGISRVLIPLQPGAFPLPVLDLRLTLPDPSLPDYSADQAMTRAGDDAYIIRCVAELTRPGTNQVTLRKAVTPPPCWPTAPASWNSACPKAATTCASGRTTHVPTLR